MACLLGSGKADCQSAEVLCPHQYPTVSPRLGLVLLRQVPLVGAPAHRGPVLSQGTGVVPSAADGGESDVLRCFRFSFSPPTFGKSFCCQCAGLVEPAAHL